MENGREEASHSHCDLFDTVVTNPCSGGTSVVFVGYPTVPHFYFQVDGWPEELVDLPDLATARCEAVRHAGRLLCDRAGEFWDRGDFSMTITDEKRLTLFTLQFSAFDAPAIASERLSFDGPIGRS